MARTEATFIPTNSNGGTGLLDLSDVPEDVQKEIEEIYQGLKTNPNGRMRIGFDTVAELEQYVLQAQSYCAQREAGAIRFRKSPTRGLPENVMDFRVTDVKETPAPTVPTVPAQNGTPVAVPAAKATAGTRRR